LSYLTIHFEIIKAAHKINAGSANGPASKKSMQNILLLIYVFTINAKTNNYFAL